MSLSLPHTDAQIRAIWTIIFLQSNSSSITQIIQKQKLVRCTHTHTHIYMRAGFSTVNDFILFNWWMTECGVSFVAATLRYGLTVSRRVVACVCEECAYGLICRWLGTGWLSIIITNTFKHPTTHQPQSSSQPLQSRLFASPVEGWKGGGGVDWANWLFRFTDQCNGKSIRTSISPSLPTPHC